LSLVGQAAATRCASNLDDEQLARRVRRPPLELRPQSFGLVLDAKELDDRRRVQVRGSQ
jgi:hypothetical protein